MAPRLIIEENPPADICGNWDNFMINFMDKKCQLYVYKHARISEFIQRHMAEFFFHIKQVELPGRSLKFHILTDRIDPKKLGLAMVYKFIYGRSGGIVPENFGYQCFEWNSLTILVCGKK